MAHISQLTLAQSILFYHSQNRFYIAIKNIYPAQVLSLTFAMALTHLKGTLEQAFPILPLANTSQPYKLDLSFIPGYLSLS